MDAVVKMLRFSVVAVAALTLGAAESPIAPGAKPERIGEVGAGEGPAWSPAGSLFFTGEGKISQWTPGKGVRVFRENAGGANGLLFTPSGDLIACEARERRVTRTSPDGKVTVLAERFEGRRFNSPNDLTIDAQGRIYFSDPRYGKRDGMEMDVEGVYRIDAPGKVVRVIGKDVERANGVLVSPDGKFLYVADNNNNNVGGARTLWRFPLRADGSVDTEGKKRIFDWKGGRGPDGVKMDVEGRLYVAGGRTRANLPYETADGFPGGVYVLSPEGKQLAFVPVPVDEVTNCAFGGADGKTLFITAGGTLWRIPVTAPGVRR